ncbi:hypothetical protein C3Y87_06010 [Carbonactinospora thermoautotrophica]|nr:hypothetical protein [Carbonactinospora thermoautotrophica]
MPCFRCGARQTDPVRGVSAWRRGVRAGTQVLICPDCQQAYDWTRDLDRCASCGSTALVRILGETQCRSCGAVDVVVPVPPGVGTAPRGVAGSMVPGLAEDVQAALERVLRRQPGRRV